MYDCEGVLESFTGAWWAIKGGDTEDRLGGLRLEQARRILVLECAVVQASKPVKEFALSTSFELHHQRPWQPELIFFMAATPFQYP